MFIGLSVVLPMVPDLDSLCPIWIVYFLRPLGQWRLSHSIIFAILLATAATGFTITAGSHFIHAQSGTLFQLMLDSRSHRQPPVCVQR